MLELSDLPGGFYNQWILL